MQKSSRNDLNFEITCVDGIVPVSDFSTGFVLVHDKNVLIMGDASTSDLFFHDFSMLMLKQHCFIFPMLGAFHPFP